MCDLCVCFWVLWLFEGVCSWAPAWSVRCVLLHGGCSFFLGSLWVFSRFCALTFGLHFVCRVRFAGVPRFSRDCAGVVGEVRVFVCGL